MRVEEDLLLSIGVLVPLPQSVKRRYFGIWLVSALAYMGDAWQSCSVVRCGVLR